MDIGLRVKLARIKVNKRQYEVAKEVGISSQYLRQIESGKVANPSREVMIKIADSLDSDVTDLFFKED